MNAGGEPLSPALCERWRAALHALDPVPASLLDAIDHRQVLQALQQAGWRAPIAQALNVPPDQLACNLSRCHVRTGRPPNLWHQDGALGHDFIAVPEPPREALLSMVTCWIALTPCGEQAPGLEWVAAPLNRLLPVVALEDAAVQACFAEHAFVRPVLQPGDVVLFTADCLHRTHLTPQMQQRRLSIELRFLDARALPVRLAADRFERWA